MPTDSIGSFRLRSDAEKAARLRRRFFILTAGTLFALGFAGGFAIGTHAAMGRVISQSVVLSESFAASWLDTEGQRENAYRLLMLQKGEKGCQASIVLEALKPAAASAKQNKIGD